MVRQGLLAGVFVGLLLAGCSAQADVRQPASRAGTPTSTGAVVATPGETGGGQPSTRAPDHAQPAPRSRIGAAAPLPAPASESLTKPSVWPGYAFDGPTDADVCLAAQFPLGRLLRRGDGQVGGSDPQSLVIRSLQAGLRSLNYGRPDPVEPTEYFGAVTEKAVRSFQDRKGLTVDGTVGPETWTALHYWVKAYAGNCP